MALTQAQVEARIEAIDFALARGERSVQFSDRSVSYRSIEELMAARAHFVTLLALLAGRVKQTLIVASKGFCS
jgi:hypothetical protein